MKKVLAIIPARGGSKGIPRKNIRDFKGKPLIAWSVEASLSSGVFSDVVVATDDEEIAQIAKEHGAEAPFLLPAELTQDNSSIIDVIVHVLSTLKEAGREYEYMALIEPTSPLRTKEHIQEGVGILLESGCDSVVSVVPVPTDYNPHWQFFVGEEKELRPAMVETMQDIIPRRQMLPESYTRNGVLYACKTDLLFGEKPTIYGPDTRAYVMDRKYEVTIDTEEDWKKAEELA